MNVFQRTACGAVCAAGLAAAIQLSAQGTGPGSIRACAGPLGALRMLAAGESCRSSETPA